jgi:hypothetical protein
MIPLQHSQLKQVHRIVLTFDISVSTVTTYLNDVDVTSASILRFLSTLFRFWTCDYWTDHVLNIKLLNLKVYRRHTAN